MSDEKGSRHSGANQSSGTQIENLERERERERENQKVHEKKKIAKEQISSLTQKSTKRLTYTKNKTVFNQRTPPQKNPSVLNAPNQPDVTPRCSSGTTSGMSAE